MAKNWWFKFDFKVWRTDSSLRRCSFETRGFWLECLCVMHETDDCTLSGSYEELGWLLGCSPDVVARCCVELQRTKTADVTLGNGCVTLMSRRLKRDLNDREQTRLRVQRHRGNGDVTTQSKSNKKEVRNKEKEKDIYQGDREAVSDASARAEEATKDAFADPVWPWPMKPLIDAFPDYLPGRITPAMIGFVESEVLPGDEPAWNATIEKYQMNFDPTLGRYLPDKTGNLLSTFRTFKAEMETKRNGNNTKINNGRRHSKNSNGQSTDEYLASIGSRPAV